MAQVVIVDSGPLVAFLDRTEREHERIAEVLKSIAPPLLTVEPVLTEVCFLLRRVAGAPEAVLRLLQQGLLKTPLLVTDEAEALERLMRKYADVPMSLADACLVRLAELDPRSRVLTLDSDFRIYRTHRRRAIRLVL